MGDRRYCKKCKTQLEYRLGNYECPDCGYSEPAASAAAETPVMARARGLSTHKNLDPGAAYKLINPEVSETAQLVEELQPKYGPKARMERSKGDSLRDERMLTAGALLAGAGFNIYTLLYTETGMSHIDELTQQYYQLPDPQNTSNLLLGLTVVGLLFIFAGLFLGDLWVKWLAAFILLLVALSTILGIMTPGAPADICYSVQGGVALLVSLWGLYFFSRDIQNTATGDDAL